MDSKTLNKKIELIQWLSTLDDKEVINRLFKFRIQENKDWWNSLSAEEKESIGKGISEPESGKLTEHTEAKKIYEKWL
jgi:hypothetical protein